jgi:hypothetical protein
MSDRLSLTATQQNGAPPSPAADSATILPVGLRGDLDIVQLLGIYFLQGLVFVLQFSHAAIKNGLLPTLLTPHL